jgi:ferredoxin
LSDSGLEMSSRGIAVDRNTFQTSIPGIFAGGNSVSESRRAIRSLAHGKIIAWSVNQFLSKDPVTGPLTRFNSTMGKIQKHEFGEFLKEAESYGGVVPEGGNNPGYKDTESIRESRRCLHCDCRKQISCRLRNYADEYRADPKHYKIGERNTFERIIQHDHVIYEPGKCIKCSLCIQITKKAGENLGLTFIGRGFNVRVSTPFNESLKQGLEKVAKTCVASCPTAALTWRDSSEE